MGVDTVAAGAALAVSILAAGISNTACRTIKLQDKILKKGLKKKKNEIRAKKHPRMHEIAPFFKNKSRFP